jgi:hypothetical protein
VRPDARVEADALDDLRGVEAVHRGVRVELVEVGHAQREVGVGEELDRLGLGGAGEEDRDVVVERAFDQQLGEHRGPSVVSDPTTMRRRVQVVVQRAALAEELGGEDDRRARVLLAHAAGEADRDRRLDDHRRVAGLTASASAMTDSTVLVLK